jgi:hypothetical protein
MNDRQDKIASRLSTYIYRQLEPVLENLLYDYENFINNRRMTQDYADSHEYEGEQVLIDDESNDGRQINNDATVFLAEQAEDLQALLFNVIKGYINKIKRLKERQ